MSTYIFQDNTVHPKPLFHRFNKEIVLGFV